MLELQAIFFRSNRISSFSQALPEQNDNVRNVMSHVWRNGYYCWWCSSEAYIGFLGGSDPLEQIIFAKHLLAASVMSAPAAVISSKILFPEKHKFDKNYQLAKMKLAIQL